MDERHYTTIGMDVSDRTIQVCVMARAEGGSPRTVMETKIPTTREGLAGFLSGQDRSAALAFETGTHCRWMDEVARGMGFRTYVANPCRLRMITESKTKNDVNDARTLARIAPADPGLLHPVRLRGAECQRMIHLHEMRGLLVRQRASAVVQLRSVAKTLGFRIPGRSPASFRASDAASWPKELRDVAWPMLKGVEQMTVTIRTYERLIRELAASPAFKAMVGRLMEVRYVGLFIATAFVAVTGGDVGRFTDTRDVGAWLGLVPGQDQSGESDRQCHATKAGSAFMRGLLVEGAQPVLRRSSADTDLKAKGMRICARGGRAAKRKAVVAVARSLAVLMAAMLKKPDAPYVPLSERGAAELAALEAAGAAS